MPEKCSKFFKKSMKNLEIFDNFERKFAFFPKFFQIFIKFLAKIWETFSRKLEICICMGLVAKPPKLANLLKS